MRGQRFGAIGLLSVVVLLGCSSKAPAPIYDRNNNPYTRTSQSHTRIERPSSYVVRRGDTLYAIAWRYGLDFKTLALWNGIGSPYTIYPEQRIVLKRPRTLPAVVSSAPDRRVAAPSRRPEPASGAPATASGSPAPTPASTTPAPTQTTTLPITPPTQPVVRPAGSGSSGSSSGWRWPTSGNVLAGFTTERKGIDIGGQKGQAVVAAAAGEVVYSGTGLIGYGELIIIKHDDRYLSAYGHNQKRLVAEGERVSAGQHIAEMGEDSKSRSVLHFEIRDNGKPVNPTGLLPSR